MMTTAERVAYLKGLMEGMKVDDSTNEGKLFNLIADILADKYGVPDRRVDEAIAADWEAKSDAYYELLAAQKAELKEYGYLKSWTLGDEK